MVVRLETFWTPCYFYHDLKFASTVVAFYTALMSVIAIGYTGYVMAGGDASQYYMPYFETDVRNTTQIAGGLAIVFFLLMIVFSYLVHRGIKLENRGLMLPWIISMIITFAYQIIWCLHLLYAYYIYLETIFVLLVHFLILGYHIYCLLCVYTQYQIIRDKQLPQFVYIYP